jgi:parallel beta-helix repeat protein
LIDNCHTTTEIGRVGAAGVCGAFDIGCLECEFTDCSCESMGGVTGGGLLLESAECCRIERCTSKYNGVTGLGMVDCIDSGIIDSHAYGATNYGISLSSQVASGGCLDCYVTGGSSWSNAEYGVILDSGERNRVSNVDSSHNTLDGFRLVSASINATIENCSAKQNGQFGFFWAAGCTGLRASDITLIGNATRDLECNETAWIENLYTRPAAGTSVRVPAGSLTITNYRCDDAAGVGVTLNWVVAGATLTINQGYITSAVSVHSLYSEGTMVLYNVAVTAGTNGYTGTANTVLKYDDLCTFSPRINLASASAIAVSPSLGQIKIAPLGGAVDDWPHLKKVMDTYAGISPILLKEGTWTCNSKQEIPSNTTLVGASGVTINQTLVYSGGADPYNAAFFAAYAGTATTTTLASPVVVGTRTIVTNANRAPGTILMIEAVGSSNLRNLFYTVISSGGGGGPTYTLTLDRPILENFAAAAVVTNITSRPTNIHIQGNGMKISGTGDRYIEFCAALYCSVSDVVMDDSSGMVGALGAGASLDIGSQESWFSGLSFKGNQTISNGLLLESAERCQMLKCTAKDVGLAGGDSGISIWDCWDCVVDGCNAYGNEYGIFLGTDGYTVGCKDCAVTNCNSYSNSDTGISINGPSLRTKISNCSANYNTATGISVNVAGTDNTLIENVSCVGNASGLRVSGTTTNTKGSNWALMNNTTQDLYIQGPVDASHVYCYGAATQNVILSGVNAVARISDLNATGTQGVASNIVYLETNATGYFDRPKVTATTAGSTLFANNTGSTLYLHDPEANQGGMTGVAGYINSTTRISGDMQTNIWAAVGTAHFNFGTVALNGAAAVAVAFRGMRANDNPNITLAAVGGVYGLPPLVLITAGVGFTVTGQAGDTSTYRYCIGD